MHGRKNPPLAIVPVPAGAPVTFDTMAQAYLEDYVLQRVPNPHDRPGQSRAPTGRL